MPPRQGQSVTRGGSIRPVNVRGTSPTNCCPRCCKARKKGSLEGRACHVRFPSEGPACHVRFRWDFRVGAVIQRSIIHSLSRGLKSRAESGAKAPHSMECGDSSPLFGEGFSLHHLALGPDGTTMTGRSGTRPSNPSNGRTRSRASIHALSGASSGRTRSSGPLAHVRSSIRFHRARQACPSEKFRRDVPVTSVSSRRDLLLRSVFGGTCLSRPLFDVGQSIAFRRGLKSRAESGAKAPHSMECGDSSPLFGEGFSLHHPVLGPDGTTMTGRADS